MRRGSLTLQIATRQFIILAGVGVAGCAGNAHYLADEEISTTLSVASDTSYTYWGDIQRIFGTPEEEHLLRIAEATYPSKASVLKAIEPAALA